MRRELLRSSRRALDVELFLQGLEVVNRRLWVLRIERCQACQQQCQREQSRKKVHVLPRKKWQRSDSDRADYMRPAPSIHPDTTIEHDEFQLNGTQSSKLNSTILPINHFMK